jgi:hypothetical protein
VSEWLSGRRFGSVHLDRLSCLEGAGEQDERALAIRKAALGPDPPDAVTHHRNLDSVLRALQEAPPEGPASSL